MRSFFATVALVSLAAAQTAFDVEAWAYQATDSVYSTTNQGADWDNGICDSGMYQSPINLTTDGAENSAQVTTTWASWVTEIDANYGTEGAEVGGVSWNYTMTQEVSDRGFTNAVTVTDE